ncbi:hypothetical protein ACH4UM_11460 [Streptomyces sp. NPDC020801]|uniref:hypothetical protein n=1 Tax=unclassified Streptomyces TaxID=2593676 RepID=UPI0037B946F1
MAAFAGLIADETRAACLLALLDGRASGRSTSGPDGRAGAESPGTLGPDGTAAAGPSAPAGAPRRRTREESGTGFALTDAGVGWFEAAGIGLDRRGRRPLARARLDWTKRRPHLAGVAGAALCPHALAAGWCVRIGSERAVKVTATGEHAFSDLLGTETAALR